MGHLTKLGTKTHFAKLTHILPLKKAWGCCYKGLFLLSPSPPSSVDCVELKLEYITSTLHRGGRGGGKMPQSDELLRSCPNSFDQGCRSAIVNCLRDAARRVGLPYNSQRAQFSYWRFLYGSCCRLARYNSSIKYFLTKIGHDYFFVFHLGNKFLFQNYLP